MILQVLPDARQFVALGNCVACQFFGGSDTGQQQQLRRVDAASAEDDFTPGLECERAVSLADFNPLGARAIE